MKKLMNIFMLSCKKASSLIDKKHVLKLSVKEKIMLHIHTSMCTACTSYQKQSSLLEKILVKHISSKTDDQVSLIRNEALKAKIISKF